MRSRFFLFLFLVVGLLEIGASLLEFQAAHLLVKPLIMLALLGYYLVNATFRSSIFIGAILFCWAGDVFLLFQNQNEIFFLLGLVAFLIGHVLYIVSYRQSRWTDRRNSHSLIRKVSYSLPVVIAGVGLLVVLFPYLGGLKLPVVIYAVVLMLMVMTAILRYGRTNAQSFRLLLIGASLFMISDATLAINKFLTPLPYAGSLIMITYIASQYLITEGVLRHAPEGRRSVSAEASA